MKDRLELFQRCPGASVVELGVCKGDFAVQIIGSGIGTYLGIDCWAGDRGHDRNQCFMAHRRVKAAGEEHGVDAYVLRRRFCDAAAELRGRKFDLVYIDGYAHTGQEGGETIRAWWRFVKSGGILAGHDYHPRWQPTIDAVDAFSKEIEQDVALTGETEPGQFPSWWFVKP